GLRNPWRIHLDPATGDQWIADVGQGSREEVNLVAAGRAGVNYGWDRMEGTLNVEGSPPPNHTLPVHEYDHGGGRCSITGGVVYRGGSAAVLEGAYLFGDFCTGELHALRMTTRGAEVDRLTPTVPRLVSFGVDGAGEVYALSLAGGVFRIAPA
ncbi:MAG: PQQ-dependent sugar dehydrogenase, partial [Actinomycetota bacterium]